MDLASLTVSDEQLMLQVKQGSQPAFTELFERYREPIFGYFRRRIADRVRAEDLAQETFLALLKGAARYEQRALFRTYVYAIAMNLLLADRRRSVKDVGTESAEPSVTNDPDTTLWVRRAIEQMDPEQREVLLLREYEQLSYEEIAGLLAVPVNTVRSRLFRARMAVKELLVRPHAATCRAAGSAVPTRIEA
jgi:RNA polymerase sigma-70 factor (ECF subfamily)